MTVLTGKNITQLAMGGSEQVDSHTLAIVEPGKLYATGDNTYGQLVRVLPRAAQRLAPRASASLPPAPTRCQSQRQGIRWTTPSRHARTPARDNARP